MSARFYASDAQSEGELVTLPDDEAQHLTRVLRLSVGARVRVFNGRGAEFDAIVENVSRNVARLRVGSPRIPTPEPRVAVTLAQAVLKGDKMDDVVRDAVMIGVAAIQPIVTARSEVSLTSLDRSRRRDRWARIAVSSAKQCGRATVPHVLEPTTFDRLVPTLSRDTALMLVEPGARQEVLTVGAVPVDQPSTATILIGPEGGWTEDELQIGGAASRLITLGERTLRADAMALVAMAALFTRWNEF
ncbi:MAG TPA: 16S rRNA (uracil(1498)-N(3))-methyltransferase [Vicinamibacterales bacterium]|nr:16S rRNA (uracil(1498)-N(3))-methyltransferase [Vicinamibacterales bacterium]